MDIANSDDDEDKRNWRAEYTNRRSAMEKLARKDVCWNETSSTLLFFGLPDIIGFSTWFS